MPLSDVVSAVAEWKTRAPSYAMFRDYYEGQHRYTFASPTFLQKYQWVLENARENLCPAVVSAFVDKLSITGWDGAGAEAASKLFAEAKLDRVANLVHTEAFRCGDGYALAWKTRRDSAARAFYHRADQIVPRTSDDDPETLDWAAKLWLDRRGFGRVNVYYPTRVERFITTYRLDTSNRGSSWLSEVEGAESDRSSNTAASGDAAEWPETENAYRTYDGDGDPDVIPHDFGRVPVVWFARDPESQGGHGRSVLRDVIPLQDGLNKSVADLIVGGEAFAQPLRYLLNYQGEKRIDPATGQATEEKLSYDETRNRIFGVRGPGPFGQLDPPDATKLIAVQDAFALKIARVVGIPAYYMTQTSGDVPSGQSLRVLSSRLTSGVGDFQQDATNPWTELAALLGVADVRPQWAPAAPTDETEELEAAKIRQDLGYPFASIARKLGEDEDDLEQIDKDRVAEEALAATAGEIAARAARDGRDVRDLLG